MKNKIFIPILVVIFGVGMIAPPAYAEVVTVSLILAAAFTSVVVTSKTIKNQQKQFVSHQDPWLPNALPERAGLRLRLALCYKTTNNI